MKTFKIAFSCFSLLLAGNIFAQPLMPVNTGQDLTMTIQSSLPGDGLVSFGVINIAQENADAEKSGANAGDTLRYEVRIKTTSSDLVDFKPIVDISNILVATDIIDAGLGEVVGNNLVFPIFSQSAPCEKVFSFFVRVKKDCGKIKTVVASAHNEKTTVKITCDLPKTGAGNPMALLIAFLVGLVAIFGIRQMRV